MIVTDIQVLIDRQNANDLDAHTTIVDAALVTHPSLQREHFHSTPLKLVSAVNGPDCPECGEPTFTVRDKSSGRTAPRCRMCINTIRRQSLGHRQYSDLEICCSCEITYDSVGIISGCIHQMRPVEDQPFEEDGVVIRIRQGIGPLCRDGCVDVTDNVLTILPAH